MPRATSTNEETGTASQNFELHLHACPAAEENNGSARHNPPGRHGFLQRGTSLGCRSQKPRRPSAYCPSVAFVVLINPCLSRKKYLCSESNRHTAWANMNLKNSWTTYPLMASFPMNCGKRRIPLIGNIPPLNAPGFTR